MSPREEAARFPSGAGDETTSARWVLPGRGARRLATLVLGHGAGGNRETEGLSLLQDALAARGVATLAFNFPYAEAKRRLPDRMPRLEACYRAALEHARGRVGAGAPLLAGGRSMGGRVATHLAASGEPLAGLVLLGYPLHAAGRPDRLRVAHLPEVVSPLLFVSGTRDRLAPRDLLAETVASLGARARLHWIEGADHGLDLPRRSGRDRAAVADEVAEVVAGWARELSSPAPSRARAAPRRTRRSPS